MPESGVRATASLEIIQFQSGESVLVGFSEDGQLVLNQSLIKFKNNQTPVSEIVPQLPNLTYSYVVVFFALMIAEIVLALAVGGWLILRWNHKLLRRSSPLFLLLIIVGILLVLTAGIIMSAGLSSSTMCILYVFFLVTGMTLILANLLVKNWRIYKIFSNRRADAVQLSDLQLLAITGILLILVLIQFFCLLLCWWYYCSHSSSRQRQSLLRV